MPIEQAGVMVVTPYNAQVRLLRERLPGWVDVGTWSTFEPSRDTTVMPPLMIVARG